MMLGSDIGEGGPPSEEEQQWLTQFPALLIVTTSMVIDRSLRKDLIEERVRCQIWLWFCMILSMRSSSMINNNTTNSNHDQDRHDHVRTTAAAAEDYLICETWMHLTIVSNLLSIGALAICSPLERIKKSNSKGSWWFSFAAWAAMMASSCIFSQLRYYTEGTQASIATFSLQVYMVSLCILWMIHWHKKRKEKLEQEMRNITSYTGSTKSSSTFVIISQDKEDGFDRSKWYTWKPSTTLQWISHVLESNNDDDDDIDNGVLRPLAFHRIDGPLLDTLSVSQLLQLQVPYGPACHLERAIQNELVRPFPKPREAELGNGMLGSDRRNAASYGGETPASHPGDFLSGFDQEYNNSDRPRNFAFAASSNNNSTSTSETTGLAAVDRHSFASGTEMLSLDPNHEDRIGDIMKERYGLELPRLRDGSTSEVDSALSKAAAVGVSPLQQASMQKKPPPPTIPKVLPAAAAAAAGMPTIPNPAASNNNNNEGGGGGGEIIPEAILKQMPPNIQEIAKRRPELVRQLLLNRQLQLADQQQQQQRQRQREDQLYTHAEEGVGEEEDDDSSNDETAQLIRRKKNKDHRHYKSTGL